jgi:hypothetical protein
VTMAGMTDHPGAADLPYFELVHMAGAFEALPAWFARMYEQAAARYPEGGHR